MLKKHLNHPAVIGACAALLTMSFVIFLPMTFSDYEISYCNHDPSMGYTCEDSNAWLGYIMAAMMGIGLFGMPIALGGVLAARHRRLRLPLKKWVTSLVSGFMAWWFIMFVVEILWLEPWRQLSTTSGETYNAYSLDAMYGTSYIIPLFLLILISYALSYGISTLWAKIPRKKSVNTSSIK